MFAEYFHQGGVMMWMLLACSILFVAVVVERFWKLGICAKLFGYRIEPAESGRNKRIFGFFKEVPPSMGLLGTVLGVVESFGLEGGRITAQAAGAGLGVACYTTIYGLAIAILAVVLEYVTDWLVE